MIPTLCTCKMNVRSGKTNPYLGAEMLNYLRGKLQNGFREYLIYYYNGNYTVYHEPGSTNGPQNNLMQKPAPVFPDDDNEVLVRYN